MRRFGCHFLHPGLGLRGVATCVVRRYLTWVTTKMSSKGQIVLPAELRDIDGIQPGQEFTIERIAPGEYRLVRRTLSNRGVVDWLLACPSKGFFTPIESESTDTL